MLNGRSPPSLPARVHQCRRVWSARAPLTPPSPPPPSPPRLAGLELHADGVEGEGEPRVPQLPGDLVHGLARPPEGPEDAAGEQGHAGLLQEDAQGCLDLRGGWQGAERGGGGQASLWGRSRPHHVALHGQPHHPFLSVPLSCQDHTMWQCMVTSTTQFTTTPCGHTAWQAPPAIPLPRLRGHVSPQGGRPDREPPAPLHRLRHLLRRRRLEVHHAHAHARPRQAVRHRLGDGRRVAATDEMGGTVVGL